MASKHESLAATALEQGLGIHMTKLGAGDKTAAVAMRRTSAKYFCLGIASTVLVLLALVIVYAGLYDDERLRRIWEGQANSAKITEQTLDKIKMQFALHKEHQATGHQITDARRALMRILASFNAKFDDLIQTGDFSPEALAKVRVDYTDFLHSEIAEFEKESTAQHEKSDLMLDKLTKFQEQSLREILTSVTDVNLKPVMDMLEDVFDAAKGVKEIDFTSADQEALEKLADGLYQGTMEVEEGLQAYAKIKAGRASWPELRQQKFPAMLAHEMDTFVEDGQLSRGKHEIALIKAKYDEDVAKARNGDFVEEDDLDEDEEEEERFNAEAKVNIDTLMKMHKLVAEGKIPMTYLELDALLEEEDEDEEDEEEEDGQAIRNEQEKKRLAEMKARFVEKLGEGTREKLESQFGKH